MSQIQKNNKEFRTFRKEDYKNYDNSRVFFSIQHFIKKEFKESKLIKIKFQNDKIEKKD